MQSVPSTTSAGSNYHCGKCGKEFTDETDEPELWIGCDMCDRWYCSTCEGLTHYYGVLSVSKIGGYLRNLMRYRKTFMRSLYNLMRSLYNFMRSLYNFMRAVGNFMRSLGNFMRSLYNSVI